MCTFWNPKQFHIVFLKIFIQKNIKNKFTHQLCWCLQKTHIINGPRNMCTFSSPKQIHIVFLQIFIQKSTKVKWPIIDYFFRFSSYVFHFG
jgi:hypothetical protein